MSEFSEGGGMFNPDFGETEKVGVVRVGEIRVTRMKNRSDAVLTL